MLQTSAKVVYNKRVKENYFKIILDAGQIARQALPGQFLNIKITDAVEPFLRRPFSIHRVRVSGIEILYEAVGKGTEILSQKKPGEYLDVIAPLGNGFTLPTTYYSLPAILVAGGMGVAPLIFLAEKLAEIKYQKSNIKNLVLIGAKTKKEILCEADFMKLGCEVKISTDDGSRGFRGKITDLFKTLLPTYYSLSTVIYACGPKPMLKEIANISSRYKIPAQVSLEEHMACGIGVCLGCVIKVKTQNSRQRRGSSKAAKLKTQFEYQRVCREGPVFGANQIVW